MTTLLFIVEFGDVFVKTLLILLLLLLIVLHRNKSTTTTTHSGKGHTSTTQDHHDPVLWIEERLRYWGYSYPFQCLTVNDAYECLCVCYLYCFDKTFGWEVHNFLYISKQISIRYSVHFKGIMPRFGFDTIYRYLHKRRYKRKSSRGSHGMRTRRLSERIMPICQCLYTVF